MKIHAAATLILLFGLLAAQEISAATGEGYKGVIAPVENAASPAPAAASPGGYSGVTSWDSVVSGSLYDFINEAGRAAAEDSARHSGSLATLIRNKRKNFSALMAQKDAIEKEQQDQHFAEVKKKVMKSIEDRQRQRELQRQ
jgi:hypothetical protein